MDDLYSLGVTLYRCVTGGYLPPMNEGGELEVREVPRSSGFCTLSLDLEALILRLLTERKHRGTVEQLTREALAVTAAGLSLSWVLALVLLLARTSPGTEETPWLATPEKVAQFAPDAGVGDDALSSAHAPEKRVGPWIPSLGRSMPSKPYPDQRRPPCIPMMETEIHGGCWVMVGSAKPPCGDRMYEYEGACHLASFDGPKTPTSGEP